MILQISSGQVPVECELAVQKLLTSLCLSALFRRLKMFVKMATSDLNVFTVAERVARTFTPCPRKSCEDL